MPGGRVWLVRCGAARACAGRCSAAPGARRAPMQPSPWGTLACAASSCWTRTSPAPGLWHFVMVVLCCSLLTPLLTAHCLPFPLSTHYRAIGVRITRIGDKRGSTFHGGGGAMGNRACKHGEHWKNWKNWKNPNARRTARLSLTGLLFQLFQLFHPCSRPRLQVLVYKELFIFLSLLQ